MKNFFKLYIIGDFQKFPKAITNDETINVYNCGNYLKDFIYIDYIIEVTSKVLKKPRTFNFELNEKMPDFVTSFAYYKIYYIGSNKLVNIKLNLKALENLLKKKLNFFLDK